MQVNRYKVDHEIQNMLLFGQVLIIVFKESNTLLVKNIITNYDIASIVVEFDPKFIIHPQTYLNKILIAGPKQVELYNVTSCNKVFSLHSQPSIEKYFVEADLVVLQPSPAVDIITMGLSDGRILLVNLKTAVVVRQFRQSFAPTCLAFSTNITREPL